MPKSPACKKSNSEKKSCGRSEIFHEASSAKGSRILEEVVLPALTDAERRFAASLGQLSIDDLARRAEGLRER